MLYTEVCIYIYRERERERERLELTLCAQLGSKWGTQGAKGLLYTYIVAVYRLRWTTASVYIDGITSQHQHQHRDHQNYYARHLQDHHLYGQSYNHIDDYQLNT